MLYETVMRSDYFLDRGRHGNYDVFACMLLECMYCNIAADYRI